MLEFARNSNVQSVPDFWTIGLCFQDRALLLKMPVEGRVNISVNKL